MACSDETRFQGIATALEAGLFPWREELWTCSDETRFQGIATRRCEMARQQTWEEFLQ